jgi:hypothetical protein
MKDQEPLDVSRRAFVTKAVTAGAVAAAASTIAVAASAAPASPKTLKTATPNPLTGETVVTPESPLVIDGSTRLGAVRLRGGQIVIRGGGVIQIDRLIAD